MYKYCVRIGLEWQHIGHSCRILQVSWPKFQQHTRSCEPECVKQQSMTADCYISNESVSQSILSISGHVKAQCISMLTPTAGKCREAGNMRRTPGSWPQPTKFAKLWLVQVQHSSAVDFRSRLQQSWNRFAKFRYRAAVMNFSNGL